MSSIPRASRLSRASAAVGVTFAAFLTVACDSTITGVPPGDQAGVGGTGNAATGGSSATMNGGGSGMTAGGATGGTATGGTATGGTGTGGSATGGSATGGSATAGSAGSGPMSTGGVNLRLLTKAEYLASLKSLFGDLTTALDLPEDTSAGGFIALGASRVTVNSTAADKYEVASRAVVAEVFGDMARRQTLVGCQAQADLSDACVETFVRAFGKRAFRRDLSAEEVQQWVDVARGAAALAGNATDALSTLTSGLLQSPYFLYRVETTALDAATDRLKYDGRSMAIRLAFFLTGAPPSAELLAAGESGQLDTVDGLRTAATPMLNDSGLVGRLTAFFYEYTQADVVMTVEKSPDLFPEFNDTMRNSMREGVRLFLEKVVLAPGADVRSYFNSDQIFSDAVLAPIYGVTPPSSGFAQLTAPPQSDRAGIMGQAGVLAAHSKPDHSSPTARGLFMLQSFLCTIPDGVPAGVDTTLVIDDTLTTRQKLELHRKSPSCAGCHAAFDPLGMALEHFDALGRYRATEDGLTIDATGTLDDGTPFDGAAELGAALAGNPPVTECLLRNFYRNVNGRDDDLYDKAQVDGLVMTLSSRGYVFRDLVADFVVSDAFRSAPRVPLTESM
jgi:hypothetical protein